MPKKELHENLLDLDWKNHLDFIKPCAMAQIHSQSNFGCGQTQVFTNGPLYSLDAYGNYTQGSCTRSLVAPCHGT